MSIQLPKNCFFQIVSPPERAPNVSILVHLLDDDSSVSVLRNTLIFHSGHFAELFEYDPERRTIVIPEISAPLFRLTECWLRTGILLPSGLRLSYADTVTIYNFCDTYAMPRLKNAVIDLVFATIFDEQLFPLSALNDVYTRTRLNCSLRKLLIDIAVAVYNWEDLMQKSELLPKEFLLEVIKEIRGKIVRLGVTMFPVEAWHKTMMESLCNWHEHVEPAQYVSGDTKPEEPDAECIDSADYESDIFDYGETRMGNGEPKVEDTGGIWHSALVMRTR